MHLFILDRDERQAYVKKYAVLITRSARDKNINEILYDRLHHEDMI